jgi:hypothetical protein
MFSQDCVTFPLLLASYGPVDELEGRDGMGRGGAGVGWALNQGCGDGWR